jgi:hypothetical protein
MSKKLIFTVEFTIDDANISSEDLATRGLEIKSEIESVLVSNKMSTEMWRYGTFQDAEVVGMELKEKYDTRQ